MAEQKVRKRKAKRYMDFGLLLNVVVLLAFGLVMLFSTSTYEAALELGDEYYYFTHQLVAILLGLVAYFIITFFPYKIYEKFAFIIYIVACGVLFLVKTPLAYSANGAVRWIRIAGVSIQPAEICKSLMIVFLASFISKLGKNVATRKGFLTTLGVALLPAFLVYTLTDNLSSAVIILGIALTMLFVSCPDYKRFIIIGVCVAGVALSAVAYAKNAESSANLNFRFNRILAWLHPEAYTSSYGMQTLQALYAIGSGGLFGKGLGESLQKLGTLPEAQNDMIFSIVCEELGLFGALAVIILFVMLIYRIRIIADDAPDMYSALLTVGVMSHIAIQVILNIAVVTNTIPNTGITLPFFSYGGSAILMQLCEIGIVSSVSYRIPVRD